MRTDKHFDRISLDSSCNDKCLTKVVEKKHTFYVQ